MKEKYQSKERKKEKEFWNVYSKKIERQKEKEWKRKFSFKKVTKKEKMKYMKSLKNYVVCLLITSLPFFASRRVPLIVFKTCIYFLYSWTWYILCSCVFCYCCCFLLLLGKLETYNTNKNLMNSIVKAINIQ